MKDRCHAAFQITPLDDRTASLHRRPHGGVAMRLSGFAFFALSAASVSDAARMPVRRAATAPAHAAWIAEAKHAIADKMRDPNSVQFRKLETAIDRQGNRKVCGEVNAKNGFGAYTGFERFVYSLDFGPTLLSSDDSPLWIDSISGCFEWK